MSNRIVATAAANVGLYTVQYSLSHVITEHFKY